MTGANRSPNHAEKQLMKYVHGLLKCPRRAVGRAQMIVNLRTFVQAHLPTEIVILRKKTRKFVASFRNLVRVVELRKWKHRAAHFSYHAAVLARNGVIPSELREALQDHSHDNFQAREITPSMTTGTLIRLGHGAQCAMWNAYELMHFHLALPCTVLPMELPLAPTPETESVFDFE